MSTVKRNKAQDCLAGIQLWRVQWDVMGNRGGELETDCPLLDERFKRIHQGKKTYKIFQDTKWSGIKTINLVKYLL